MNKWILPLSLVLAASGGVAQGAGDAEAGKQKAAACAACHGTDGNSVNPQWPKVAGQHASYLVKQLQAFKSGARENPLMSAQAQNLSEQDMADLAAYFSSQEQTEGTAAADKVALGEKIYRGGNPETGVAACIGCHGPTGSGNPPAVYPMIAGQHADYLAKTLSDFRAGDRANDPGRMMRGVAGKMSDAEIAAVAQYLQGLR
ncbi:MAG: c-type cytochrome [Chromatiales bacterium]|jgi:cytochrome c553